MTNISQLHQKLNEFVDNSNIPGYSLLTSKNRSELSYQQYGLMDVERNKPIQRDTIYRIYSMTKPLTSVAMMQLWERGLFSLDDPVHKFIPAWRELAVYDGGNQYSYRTKKCERPMLIRDLLTHTSGLSYGLFDLEHPVDQLYHSEQVFNLPGNETQADRVEKLASLPLKYSPGQRWHYSFATDVIGYLVEQLSASSLDQYILSNICQPLGMTDTGFHVAVAKTDRFAACYSANESNHFSLQDDPQSSSFLQRPTLLSGGGGMVSTIDDYHKFCCAMLGGGEFNGTRILSTDTTTLMTQNHLPNNRDLAAMGQSVFSETTFSGVGFGLGYAVMLDPQLAAVNTEVGEFNWGGMAGTYHFTDPRRALILLFMTQLIPSSSYPIRPLLRNLQL